MSGHVPIGGTSFGLGLDAPLTIERTTGGGVRITCPRAPGWTRTARSVQDLAQAMREGWAEAAVAAYAAEHGQPYDLTLHDEAAAEAARTSTVLPADLDERTAAISQLACSVVPTTSTGGRQTATTHDPLAWKPLPDGRWVSPNGRIYGSDTQVVQRVTTKRAAMGVGTQPLPRTG